MALPNVQIYILLNMKSLLYWTCDTSPSDIPVWLQIESSSCSPISPSALVCSPIPLHIPQSCQNLVVLDSLKIWSQFRKHYGLVSMSTYAPVAANHLFPTSLINNDDQWSKKSVD